MSAFRNKTLFLALIPLVIIVLMIQGCHVLRKNTVSSARFNITAVNTTKSKSALVADRLFEARLKAAGLSPGQVNALESIRAEGMAKTKDLRDTLANEHAELAAEMVSPTAGEEKTKVIQVTMAQQQAQLKQIQISTWFKMRHIMSASQLKKLIAIQKQYQGDYKMRYHT